MGDFSSSHSAMGTIQDDAYVDGNTYCASLKAYANVLIAKYPLSSIIWTIKPPRNVEKRLKCQIEENVRRASQWLLRLLWNITVFLLPLPQDHFQAVQRNELCSPTSYGIYPWNNIQRIMVQVIAETMNGTLLFYNESYLVTPPGDTSNDSGDDTTGKTLIKITATPVSGYALFEFDKLNMIKQAITVKATYSDLSESKITNYIVADEMTAGKSGTKVLWLISIIGGSSAIICYDSAGLYYKTIAGTYEYSLDQFICYIRVNGDIKAQTITCEPRN